MISIRNATQKDLQYVRQNPIDTASQKYGEMKLSGWAKTAIVNGDIIGIGGVVEYWKGCGEGWLILTKQANDHKVGMVMVIREVIAAAIKELNLKRFQVVVRTDFKRAIHLVEKLGFVYESTKKCYLPDGKDAYEFVMIIGES